MDERKTIADLERELAQARAEARFYRKVLDGAHDVIGVVDAEGRMRFVGQRYGATGLPPDQALGVSVVDRVHPDDRPLVEETLKGIVADGPDAVRRVEYRRPAPGGRWTTMEGISRNLLHDPDVRGIVIVGREVDDAVRLREELRDAHARYERAMQVSKEAIWERDLVTDAVVMSPRAFEALGYEPGELPPEADVLRTLMHPDDRTPARVALDAHLANGAPYDVEVRVRRKAGDYRWYRVVGEVVRDAAGRPARMIGRVADVHDHKLAETALRDSERMFRSLFESTSVAVTLRDVHEQRFIDCNDAALRLYGAPSREALMRTRPADLAPRLQPDGRPTADVARDLIARALRDGSARHEWVAARLDGEAFHAELRITVIALEGGRAVMQTMIEDVSERKRAEEATRERARREALVSRVSRQFVKSTADAALPFALEALGSFLGAGRVRARQLLPGGDGAVTLAEWTAPGVVLADPVAGAEAADLARFVVDRLTRDGCLVIDDVEDLPPEIRALRRPRDLLARAHGLLVVPLQNKKHLMGWIVVEEIERRAWSDEDVNVARVVAEIVSMGRARAEAEAATRASEERYRALVERSRDMILVVTPEPRVLYASPAVVDTTGYTSEELLDDPALLARTIAPASVPLLEQILDQARRGVVPEGIVEWSWRKKDGTYAAHESVFAPIHEGGRLVALHVMSRDVTDRRKAEEARRRRAAREELLSDVSRRFLDDDPETAIDAALERLCVTLDAERVSLFAPDSGTGRLRCTHRWSVEGVDAPWESLDSYPVPDGAFTSLEGVSLGPITPGEPRDPREPPSRAADEWLAALQRDSGRRILHAPVGYAGRLFGLVSARAREGRAWSEDDAVTLRAIGELVAVGRVRRAADLALAKAKEDAVAASVTKSAFLANMSHELRTPLNGVIGMVDLLASTPLDDRQRRYAEVARASASLLLSVINDILDFSKIEAGKLELDAVPFALPEVVGEVTSIVALGAQEKGLELRGECDPRLDVPLVGDPARLRQVLLNLVSNAVKFTDAGGVTLRASLVGEGHGSRGTVRARVEVTDTGIGIPRSAQPTLFRPFTQVDASAARQHGGTGLGLAISREIVDRMGGAIGVESAPGEGSTFWFEVPFGKAAERPAAPAPSVAPAARPAASARPARVLLVEDSPVNAEVASEILRSAGYEIDLVTDGGAVCDAARARPYDIVLMDCQLPSIDGYEATRRLRALERDGALPRPSARGGRDRPLPIVALTASVTRDDLDRCFAAGMDDHVSKPVDARRLLALIARHLDGAEAPASERAAKARAGARGARAVVNLAAAIDRLRGDRALLGHIAKQFAEAAPETRAKLRAAVEQRDAKALAFIAHRLRGQASSFDGDALVGATEALEDAARRESWSAVGASLLALERELDRLLRALMEPAEPAETS